jgi:hypothetical protein
LLWPKQIAQGREEYIEDDDGEVVEEAAIAADGDVDDEAD